MRREQQENDKEVSDEEPERKILVKKDRRVVERNDNDRSESTPKSEDKKRSRDESGK